VAVNSLAIRSTALITVALWLGLTAAAQSPSETFDPVLLLGGSMVTGDVEHPVAESEGGVGLGGRGRTRTLEVTPEWIRFRTQDQPTIEVTTTSVTSLAYVHYGGTADRSEIFWIPIPGRRTATHQTLVTLGVLAQPDRPGTVVLQVRHSDRQRIVRALVRVSGRPVQLVAEDRNDLPAGVPTTIVRDRTISLPGVPVWTSRTIRSRESVRTIAFSPDGRSAAIVAGRRLELWDASLSRPAGDPLKLDDDIEALTFTAEGRELVGCTGPSLSSSHRVVVWDIATRRVVWRVPQRSADAMCQLSESGRWAVQSRDWKTAALLLDIERRRATPFPSPGLVDLAGDFGVLRKFESQRFNEAEIWRLDPLELAFRLAPPGLEGNFSAKIVLDQGRRLVVERGYGGVGPVLLLDVATGRVIASTVDRKVVLPTKRFFFNADRSLVAEVTGGSQSALLWRVPSFEAGPLASHSGRPGVFAFNRSGRFAALTSLGHVVMWDLDRATPIGYCAATRPGIDSSWVRLWVAPDGRSIFVVNAFSGELIGCSEP
jgi:WD40 repeat protein